MYLLLKLRDFICLLLVLLPPHHGVLARSFSCFHCLLHKGTCPLFYSLSAGQSISSGNTLSKLMWFCNSGPTPEVLHEYELADENTSAPRQLLHPFQRDTTVHPRSLKQRDTICRAKAISHASKEEGRFEGGALCCICISAVPSQDAHGLPAP